VTQILPGEPVEVAETRDGWAQIATAYDYPGWVRESALAGVTDTETWLGVSGYNDSVEAAREYLGAPYEWGGMTELGIDCSGLVHMAYRATGRLIPRDADQQEAAADPVDERDARSGDLVCFGEPGEAHHIGFWLGDGRILHATGRDGVNAVVDESLANVDAGPIRFARFTDR
jgi:gamma-D-glutamyl-L-lysine dipeptidyl-peptidase